MKFNEFKNPQLTEEQIVLSYCKGEITKENAVSQLSEFDWRDQLNKIAPGLVDSSAQQAAQDKAKSDARKKGLSGQDVYDAGQAALDATPGVDGKTWAEKGLSVGPNAANAASPKPGASVDDFASMPRTTPKPGASVDDFASMPRTTPKPGASVDDFASMPRTKAKAPPVAATAANTRGYDQTLALQKKLIAQGADIKADGMMGPNTRAAMKAAGMGAKKPVAKKKLSGPERLSRLADIPAVSKALGARGEMDADSEFADPNAMTRRKPKAVPKPKKKKGGSPGTFLGMPIDDPEGGSDAFFGGKTLPSVDYDKAFGGDGDNMSGGGNPQYRSDKGAKPTKPKPTPSKPSKPPRVADKTKPPKYNFPTPV